MCDEFLAFGVNVAASDPDPGAVEQKAAPVGRICDLKVCDEDVLAVCKPDHLRRAVG